MIVTTTPPNAPALPYTEIALDPATWDLIVPKILLKGVDACVQNLRVRLGFWLGEWFLDTRQGMPYRERVLIKSPVVPSVESLFRKAILSTPGFVAVSSCKLGEINGLTRAAILTFVAKLANGAEVRATREPFIMLGIGG